jgi:splicing factor 3B subunit 5
LITSLQDKFNLNNQLEHLQMKYIGTGHADLTKQWVVLVLFSASSVFSEWVTNQHRDSLASYIGHTSLAAYFAIAENESIARVKYNCYHVRSHCNCELDIRLAHDQPMWTRTETI